MNQDLRRNGLSPRQVRRSPGKAKLIPDIQLSGVGLRFANPTYGLLILVLLCASVVRK